MNSRSLSPFLISFALVSLEAMCERVSASELSGASPVVQSQESAPAVTATQAPATPVASYTLSQEELLTQVRDLIVSHYNLEGELQLELLRPWITPAASREPVTVNISDFPTQLVSSLLLHIKVESAGKTVWEPTISLRAQLWRDAWATREPVTRDEVFDSSCLEVRRVDTLRERDILPTTSGDRNFSFTRGVSAGRLLNWRDISRRALVRKGELVDVAAVDGMLSITMKAVALQNGAAGEMISVRNLQSKKDIAAQVVSEKRVQVRF